MGKILVIDDEKSIRRALTEILEFEDFEVDEAEDGKEGLAKAKASFYDIIFCDIKMPKMDGMEVLEEIQKEKLESPVIMISGHGNIETAVEAIKKGAFDLDRFLSVLEADLEKGLPVNIYLKGYTSPRFLESYNYNLGFRRVNSVKNELMRYSDGALRPYIQSGQLNVKEKSFGELESPEDVESAMEDERNSIFSVNASKERRVEIVGVDRE
jgi:CheY-like chemotaxis protein